MDDLLAVEGVDVFFVGPRAYLRMACGTRAASLISA
jgi:2-keto-3-deoxy-L-rhamnonate aldolase RhmA